MGATAPDQASFSPRGLIFPTHVCSSERGRWQGRSEGCHDSPSLVSVYFPFLLAYKMIN